MSTRSVARVGEPRTVRGHPRRESPARNARPLRTSPLSDILQNWYSPVPPGLGQMISPVAAAANGSQSSPAPSSLTSSPDELRAFCSNVVSSAAGGAQARAVSTGRVHRRRAVPKPRSGEAGVSATGAQPVGRSRHAVGRHESGLTRPSIVGPWELYGSSQRSPVFQQTAPTVIAAGEDAGSSRLPSGWRYSSNVVPGTTRSSRAAPPAKRSISATYGFAEAVKFATHTSSVGGSSGFSAWLVSE